MIHLHNKNETEINIIHPNDHEDTQGEQIETTTEHKDFKIAFTGVAGNILEWYDFAIFGYFSDIIGDDFFPPQEGNASLLESFAIFGLAFLVRPIGAAVIGKMGDQHGRKQALETAIFLMAWPTFLMGCLPTYSMVGYLSTILLIITRIFQGLSVGGQFISSVVFTLERSERKQWGFWSSTVYAASSVGVTLGSVFATIIRDNLTPEQVRVWGWRIPFWFGAFGALPAIYLRFQVEENDHVIVPSSETPMITDKRDSFTSDKNPYMLADEERNTNTPNEVHDPLSASLSKSNRRPLLAVVLVNILPAFAYYMIAVWLVTFMTSLLDPPIANAYEINSINGLLGGILFTMMGGLIADKVNNNKLLMVGGFSLLGIVSPIALSFIGSSWGDNENTVSLVAFFIQMFLFFVFSLPIGAMLVWSVLIFPPEIRGTSANLGYNIPISIFGGFSPLIATLLVDDFGNAGPGYFVTALTILSLIGLCIAPKSNQLHLLSSTSEPLLS